MGADLQGDLGDQAPAIGGPCDRHVAQPDVCLTDLGLAVVPLVYLGDCSCGLTQRFWALRGELAWLLLLLWLLPFRVIDRKSVV